MFSGRIVGMNEAAGAADAARGHSQTTSISDLDGCTKHSLMTGKSSLKDEKVFHRIIPLRTAGSLSFLVLSP
jgi:hypothetical protein